MHSFPPHATLHGNKHNYESHFQQENLTSTFGLVWLSHVHKSHVPSLQILYTMQILWARISPLEIILFSFISCKIIFNFMYALFVLAIYVGTLKPCTWTYRHSSFLGGSYYIFIGLPSGAYPGINTAGCLIMCARKISRTRLLLLTTPGTTPTNLRPSRRHAHFEVCTIKNRTHFHWSPRGSKTYW